jgi:uncharacterized protein (TIGR03067 family)
VNKSLPPRPNLDHLRRQAKALLAAIDSGDPAAIRTMREHLPAANDMSEQQVRTSGFRLADAQSAVARQTGFASWPQLARHVEQLRALEGTWIFESLEVDGGPVPPAAMSSSRILIDGDRFRTESPEAIYEGVFNIDVEAAPNTIDIEFIAGPEAGNWNYGIFRFEKDRLDICLDMTGKGRPKEFKTAPGTGHALESLRRASKSRPEAVTGGTAPAKQDGPSIGQPSPCQSSPDDFPFVPSPTLDQLQGEWCCERLVRDGSEMPKHMTATGRRSAKGNEVKITFGGQVIIHALVRINETADPVQIDYLHISGSTKGTTQQGILEWKGETACFCMSAPGQPRPADATCPPGSGRTLSHWRRV